MSRDEGDWGGQIKEKKYTLEICTSMTINIHMPWENYIRKPRTSLKQFCMTSLVPQKRTLLIG